MAADMRVISGSLIESERGCSFEPRVPDTGAGSPVEGANAFGGTCLRVTSQAAETDYTAAMSSGSPEAYGPLLFEAVIRPHRSLSPRGLRWLLAAIAGAGSLVAVRFWMIGAWPVIGFFILEVGLAALLLYLNHRSARAQEKVLLHGDRLRLVTIGPSGTSSERSLPSAWLTIRLEEHPRRALRLLACTRTAHAEIGLALGEVEKRDLAHALRSALHAARHPRFDNPQLRENP